MPARSAFFAAFLAISAWVYPLSLAAAEDTAWSAEASAALSIKRFGYREYAESGRLLDQEDGSLPGAVLTLRVAREDWRIEAEVAGHAGSVVYDGQTTLGTPIGSRTDTVLGDANVRLGQRFARWDAEITPYAGAGLHYWDRDIRPTQTAGGTYVNGVREIYRWYSLELGVRVALDTAVEALRFGFDVRAFRIFRPSMEFNGAGFYDPATLALGARNGWHLGLPLEYSLGAATILRAELYAEGWEFGRSPTQDLTSGGVVVGTIAEPRSETRMMGVTLGVAYRFY